MKKPHFFLILTSLFLSILANGQYILTLQFDQMDPYLGKQLVTRVFETNTGKEVGRKTIDSIENVSFSFDLYVLLDGRSYTIDYIIDLNASGDYDPPPSDHAWRQFSNNVTGNISLSFTPDENFTNTGLPDPFPYSTYDAVWGGKWFNLTFGSTDTIEGLFQLTCDSFYGYFTTAGVFGNPAQVEFDTSGVLPDDSENVSDTVVIRLDPPWTGQVIVVDEAIHGDLELMGIRLQFTGTVGAKQILSLYAVSLGGNPIANGYFYLRELEINNNTPELEIELTANAEVTCFDGSDGFLATNAIGGLPGYTYLWSNDETTAEINNLTAGDYSVTVTDSLGCTAEMYYSVSQAPQIVTTWFTDQVSCTGLCDGSIDLIMIGGVPPYSFIWSNGLSTEDAFDLCAGTYTPTITDAVGCMASAPITVFEPDSLIIHLVAVIPATTGQSDGIIEVFVSGGTPPYFYSIYGGPFQASNIFTGLPAGQYTPTVRDANGCLIEIEVIVNELTAVRELEANHRFYPNPASSFINIESDVPISVEIHDLHGNIFIRSKKASYHYIPVTNLPSGIHMMKISDDKGSKTEKIITINSN